MARLTSRALEYSSAVGIYSESLKQPALRGGGLEDEPTPFRKSANSPPNIL